MIDITRQVAYWRDSAREDWDVAQDLIGRGRVRHALFFAHLALEKVLKAHVCRHTNDLAPRMHNLVRLVEIAGIRPSQAYMDVLAEMNAFNLEGRYPDLLTPPPSLIEAQGYLTRTQEVLEWLLSLL